jgi:probable rRNA maturation factor
MIAEVLPRGRGAIQSRPGLTLAGPLAKLPRVPALVRYEGRGRAGVSHAEVARRAERMLRKLRLARAELSILLCDDTVMRRIHKRHLGDAHATDVLSFEMSGPQAGPQHGPRMLGDVVIAMPVARRQARVARHRVLDEVTELLAHGLLHLLGHDHQTPTELARMKARTARLVAAAAQDDPPGPKKRRSGRDQ